jgi:hypothetical protein
VSTQTKRLICSKKREACKVCALSLSSTLVRIDLHSGREGLRGNSEELSRANRSAGVSLLAVPSAFDNRRIQENQTMLAKLRGAYVPVLGTLQPKKHAAVLLCRVRWHSLTRRETSRRFQAANTTFQLPQSSHGDQMNVSLLFAVGCSWARSAWLAYPDIADRACWRAAVSSIHECPKIIFK